jgi:hypothetical protein
MTHTLTGLRPQERKPTLEELDVLWVWWCPAYNTTTATMVTMSAKPPVGIRAAAPLCKLQRTCRIPAIAPNLDFAHSHGTEVPVRRRGGGGEGRENSPLRIELKKSRPPFHPAYLRNASHVIHNSPLSSPSSMASLSIPRARRMISPSNLEPLHTKKGTTRGGWGWGARPTLSCRCELPWGC